MLFAEIDASGWVVIIGAITLGIIQVANLVITYLNGRNANASAQVADVKVSAVAQKVDIATQAAGLAAERAGIAANIAQESGLDRDVKLEEIAKVGKTVHSLVNSAMGVQLKVNAELARWKADQTKLPEDREAADKAENLYREHEAKQIKADEENARK
jgi:4-amino-4-deoxy-L-arabinose transferase-like glycosyltransferase